MFEPSGIPASSRCRIGAELSSWWKIFILLSVDEIANKPRFPNAKFGSVAQLSSEKIDKTQPDKCHVEESL